MDDKLPKTKWVIRNSCLLLSVNGDSLILIPSASEIYDIEFKSKSEIKGYVVEKPSKGIKNLLISRIPLNLEIKVDVSNEKNKCSENSFQCRVVGKSNSVEYEIENPLSRIADHTIVDNTWFPFLKGSIEEVHRIFEAGEITDPNSITLRQYFYLMKGPSDLIKINFVSLDFDKNNFLKGISIENDVPGFRGKLYPYQAVGYRWLNMMSKEDIGCILADEMGLGKTIQIICLIAKQASEQRSPSLVIAPATLLENWRREFYRFVPSIKLLVHRGSSRTAFPSELEKMDVIVTSYDTAVQDLHMLKMIKWNITVLDEAQAIKNPDAMRTKYLKKIPSRFPIAVTGTPVENRLTDLWSIMDYVFPGFLGTRYEFEGRFENESSAASILEPLISPVILRRTIKQVADDLPEKIEIPQSIAISLEMMDEYETIRKKAIEEYTTCSSFQTLLKLRMFCTHPYLLEGGYDDPSTVSPKYCRLIEILEEIIENKEQALIFTSFRKMIDILMSDLGKKFPGIYIDWIDGRVPIDERQDKVDRFNECNMPAVLLLNPKAAGTGLNLTSANHVIHYNPVWNPAVEDQASARAYRRGQTRPVTIHRLFFTDTIEEVMVDRLETKREMAESAIVGTTGSQDDYIDIIRSLEITPFRREAIE